MKRILITEVFPLEGSGSGQYTLDLGYWLNKQGHDVTLMMTANGRTTLHQQIIDKTHEKDRFSELKLHEIMFPHQSLKDFPTFTGHSLQNAHFTFHNMTKDDAKSYVDLWITHLEQEFEKGAPDLIISNCIAPLTGIIDKALKKHELDVPVIQVSHGPSINAHEETINGTPAREKYQDPAVFDLFFDKFFDTAKESAKLTICHSKEAEKDLKRLGFKDIHKHNNAFDSEIFHHIKEDFDTYELIRKSEGGLFQDKNDSLLSSCCSEFRKNFQEDYLGGLHSIFNYSHIFVFTGKFTINSEKVLFKGIDRLLDAAAILRKKRNDIGFIAFGNGERHHHIISQAYAKGLDNFFFLGYQDNIRVIPYWYNLASAGIFPSREEQFGMAALECAGCGTPIITSDCGTFPSFVPGIGGEMINDYPDGLVKAIETCIDEDWKTTRLASVKKAGKFGWGKIAKEFEKKVIQPFIGGE